MFKRHYFETTGICPVISGATQHSPSSKCSQLVNASLINLGRLCGPFFLQRFLHVGIVQVPRRRLRSLPLAAVQL